MTGKTLQAEAMSCLRGMWQGPRPLVGPPLYAHTPCNSWHSVCFLSCILPHPPLWFSMSHQFFPFFPAAPSSVLLGAWELKTLLTPPHSLRVIVGWEPGFQIALTSTEEHIPGVTAVHQVC